MAVTKSYTKKLADNPLRKIRKQSKEKGKKENK